MMHELYPKPMHDIHITIKPPWYKFWQKPKVQIVKIEDAQKAYNEYMIRLVETMRVL